MWTARFRELSARNEWSALDEDLKAIEAKFPDQYRQWNLGYLHARVQIEDEDNRGAIEKLTPFLVPGNPFRDLALFHRSEIAAEAEEPDEAARYRQELIAQYPKSLYRDESIDHQLDYFSSKKDLAGLTALSGRLYPSASTSRRRELDSRAIELLARQKKLGEAIPRGLQLLRGGTMDDSADRVARTLDQPDIVSTLNPEDLALLGESARNHRHFDRAVALLQLALPKLPARHDEILFAIGRSHFGNERYREAEALYLQGSQRAVDPRMKATFFFHASRCRQLLGNDRGAEEAMTQAIGVPGKFPATSAALTQRLRTRARQKRFAEAASDAAQLRRLFPQEHAVVEASLAYATSLIAAGRPADARKELETIPQVLLDKYDPSEIQYWKARSFEASDPHAAFLLYLKVLRADVPTHFAYFARQRVRQPAMAAKIRDEIASREREVSKFLAAKNLDLARQVQTDIALLSPDLTNALGRLREIYAQIPKYNAVMTLEPAVYPTLPTQSSGTTEQLMAMGLFDEAIDSIPAKYPLRPLSSALTQSQALNLGSASRESIYAIEVLMKAVPGDFVPDLLPVTVKQLLYPRYFYDFIVEDANKYKADPRLVLSIMREESRFNPRAKSEAAARGLLQFIITTARSVGRDLGIVELSADDLYDPRVIIQLGAKYIASLLERFEGNSYKTAAAYNAGPNQVALWNRLSSGVGDDYFLTSINFDETKHYVRKVLNSYQRYGETYEQSGPVGGMRAEP